MKVEAMFFDYDGTLSPIDVERREAQLTPALDHVLSVLSKRTLIGVVTTKDFRFIRKRTSFAQVLACIGGLEILAKEEGEYKVFYKYKGNRSPELKTLYVGIPSDMFFVEEKQLSTGEIVGFCLDWRRQNYPNNKIKDRVDYLTEKARKSSLYVVRGKGMPFLDVYVSRIDKGMALKRISKRFSLNLANCMYFGDSRLDNSAFRSVGLPVGILHNENKNLKLECDKFVKFKDLTSFLEDFLTSFNA
jgi:HAD superfamily hydrolase (TIGR01484 family)